MTYLSLSILLFPSLSLSLFLLIDDDDYDDDCAGDA